MKPELRKLVQFCRKNGIIRWKSKDFEFTISRLALQLPKKRQRKVEIPIAGRAPSSQDMLLWSATAPFIDENA